jgi:microcystin-dependent protein
MPLVVLAGSRETIPMHTSTATATTDLTPPQRKSPKGARMTGAPNEKAGVAAAAAAQLVAGRVAAAAAAAASQGPLNGLPFLVIPFIRLLLLCALVLLQSLSLQLSGSLL